MDPVTAALIAMLILVIIGGVWGTLLIRSFLEQRSARLSPASGSDQLEAVLEEYRQLEVRLDRLEEEVAFLRELRASDRPDQLPAAGEEERPGSPS